MTRSEGGRATLATLAQLAAGLLGFLVIARNLPDSVAVGTPWLAGLAVTALAAATAWWWVGVPAAERGRTGMRDLPLLGLGAGAVLLAACSLFVIHDYLRVPVDMVSFAESMFVVEVIKMREGIPVFLPPGDNNSYPYMPGAPLAAWGISRLLGAEASIPVMRTITFGFALAAAVVVTFAFRDLVRWLVPTLSAAERQLLIVPTLALAILAVLDVRFNGYTTSLHNDSLALLLSAAAFWVAVRVSIHGPTGYFTAMTVLPVLAFAVKQSLGIWAAGFVLLVMVAERRFFRPLLRPGLPIAVLILGVLAAAYRWAGGEDFIFWVFVALGRKDVSLARVVSHGLDGGLFLLLIVGAGLLVCRPAGRGRLLVTLTALLYGVESYTSGVGFASNHMGPAVLMSIAWGMVLFAWALERARTSVYPDLLLHRPALALVPLLLVASQGWVRQPRYTVPADLARYVAEIDAEFEGMSPDSVLTDFGSWPYVKAGVVLKDRADPVAEHAGENQAVISDEYIAPTRQRFASGLYPRILVHSYDNETNLYDFRYRGTGLREALESAYEVKRVIPGVALPRPWLQNRGASITVLERRPAVR